MASLRLGARAVNLAIRIDGAIRDLPVGEDGAMAGAKTVRVEEHGDLSRDLDLYAIR
jgi:hypothetical protein